MAKAQAFGDKVRGKTRTHKKMVRYILPLKKDKGNSLRFREGMLAVPEEKEHADYITEQMDSLIK
ncbi:MAG: hypothetical protein H8E26_15090 [FCB group bacterium]|nr:hypothetical protein [FCB group bacterium]MBL7027062.1 hypothetical protein [Candidatus Neomarinimicrobiota bacterium]MBL7123020.1 hypothetical protein [Candidatus Neomarinimicrobiota bacterium]